MINRIHRKVNLTLHSSVNGYFQAFFFLTKATSKTAKLSDGALSVSDPTNSSTDVTGRVAAERWVESKGEEAKVLEGQCPTLSICDDANILCIPCAMW